MGRSGARMHRAWRGKRGGRNEGKKGGRKGVRKHTRKTLILVPLWFRYSLVAFQKPTTEFAQPRLSRAKRGRSQRGGTNLVVCLFLYGRSPPRHPHDRPYRNKHTTKFVPPRWGRPRFAPTQTGLCKFGRGLGFPALGPNDPCSGQTFSQVVGFGARWVGVPGQPPSQKTYDALKVTRLYDFGSSFPNYTGCLLHRAFWRELFCVFRVPPQGTFRELQVHTRFLWEFIFQLHTHLVHKGRSAGRERGKERNQKGKKESK